MEATAAASRFRRILQLRRVRGEGLYRLPGLVVLDSRRFGRGCESRWMRSCGWKGLVGMYEGENKCYSCALVGGLGTFSSLWGFEIRQMG